MSKKYTRAVETLKRVPNSMFQRWWITSLDHRG